MEKNKEKRTALTILVALTLAFIWGNSLMPGAISGAISDWFGAVLSHICLLVRFLYRRKMAKTGEENP